LTCHRSFTPHLILLSSFFFHCSGTPRDLHSFPTRRSSDLAAARRAGPGAAGPLEPGDPLLRRRGDAVPGHPPRDRALPQEGRLRSEEHTSELQSPYDLVCRLLLEKKKKTKETDNTERKVAH